MLDSTLPKERTHGTALLTQIIFSSCTQCPLHDNEVDKMSDFNSLTLALEEWFDKLLSDMPDAVRQRIKKDFSPMPWDDLNPDQRRIVALQWDCQHDPATEKDRQYWWDFFWRKEALEKQIAEWSAIATPTASDLAQKEARLDELKKELARTEQQERQARGDYYPERKRLDGAGGEASTTENPPVQYVAYPKAISLLIERLSTTREELAAWIFMGPNDGGIAAYLNAKELEPPQRFYFDYYMGDDYLSPLMACWFLSDDIANFQPADRYITGKALIERWSKHFGIEPKAFIIAKIRESRLTGMHPTLGMVPDDDSSPLLESGLFRLSDVKDIDVEDCGVTHSDAPKSETPQIFLNAPHETETDADLNKSDQQARLMQVETSTQNEKPWLIYNRNDPEPKYSWYTPARFFARALVKEDPTLLVKSGMLAKEVADAMKKVGCMKRGGKKPFDPTTVKKAFTNMNLG